MPSDIFFWFVLNLKSSYTSIGFLHAVSENLTIAGTSMNSCFFLFDVGYQSNNTNFSDCKLFCTSITR
jgi:hypothetical protein